MKKLIPVLLKAILVFILISIIARFALDYFAKYTQNLNFGSYEFPGGYFLMKISSNDNIITDKDHHTIIESNVTHVAFNMTQYWSK